MFITNRRKARLSRILLTAGVLLGLILPLSVVYAGDMEVRNLRTSNDELTAMVSLYGKAARETKLSATVMQDPPVPLVFKASPPSLHLGIIVDSASLCRPLGLDAAVLKLLAMAPQTLSKSSRLSVIAYTGHSLEVLAQAVPVAEARRIRFSCDSKSVSGSPEKALGRFVIADDGDGLPKVAWLFSSGNIRLHPAALQNLKKSGVPLDVFLYNKALGAALSVVAEEQSKQLAEGQYHFQALGIAEVPTPATYLTLRAPIPATLEGGSVAVKFAALKGEEVVAAVDQVVDLPKPPGMGLLLMALLAITALALLAAVVYVLVRFFRKPTCAQCGLPLAAGQSQCAFPHRGEDAALIGNWLGVDEATREQKKVLRLDRDVIEIGTHRRSRIPLVRPRGLRRACLAKIRRVQLGNGKVAYRIEPTLARGYFSLDRNGTPIVAPRNLANGDRLRFGNTEVSFVIHQEV